LTVSTYPDSLSRDWGTAVRNISQQCHGSGWTYPIRIIQSYHPEIIRWCVKDDINIIVCRICLYTLTKIWILCYLKSDTSTGFLYKFLVLHWRIRKCNCNIASSTFNKFRPRKWGQKEHNLPSNYSTVSLKYIAK